MLKIEGRTVRVKNSPRKNKKDTYIVDFSLWCMSMLHARSN